MKPEHHQLLGLNTLMVMDIIQTSGPALASNLDLEPVMEKFRPNRKEHRTNRKIFKNYLAAPDYIRDMCIEMPLGMDDRYEFRGHSLSAFQHFIIPDDGSFRGYDWDRDDSLSLLEELGDLAMTISSTHVKYDTTVQEYGFSEAILAGSPVNKLVTGRQKGVDLDDFEFPAAAEVGGYYGDSVAKGAGDKLRTRVKAAGFTLHFVMDACCAHHIKGFLLSGHLEWEQRIHSFWASRFEMPQDQKSLNSKFRKIAQEVVKYLQDDAELAACATVAEVIESNAGFTTNWLAEGGNQGMAMRGEINRHEVKRICNRAIASCIVALVIMFKG